MGGDIVREAKEVTVTYLGRVQCGAVRCWAVL